MVALTVGCGGDSSGPGTSPASDVILVSGDAQPSPEVGTQLPLPSHLPIAVCPLGQFDVAFGPNVDPVSFRTHTFSGGGRIGWMTGNPERFNVVPTAGFSFVRTGMYTSYSLLLVDQTLWDDYSIVHVGAGLRFNHSRMAVTPGLSFPMVDGADPTFNVTFSSSF